MPHAEIEAATNRNDAPQENILKFVFVAVAMALLAGCAVTVPLREITPSGHILAGTPEGDLACAADPECADGRADAAAYRHTLVNQDRTLR